MSDTTRPRFVKILHWSNDFVLNFAGADWIFYPPGTVELIGGLPKHPRSSGGATDFFLEK